MSIPAFVTPMGVDRTADPLEAALAFQAQSIERLIQARTLEAIAKQCCRGERSWVLLTAEEGTQAAAMTLDAATQELAATIKDEIKTQLMAAIAAMESPSH